MFEGLQDAKKKRYQALEQLESTRLRQVGSRRQRYERETQNACKSEGSSFGIKLRLVPRSEAQSIRAAQA